MDWLCDIRMAGAGNNESDDSMKAILVHLDCALCRETPAWCLAVGWWIVVSLFVIIH